MAKGIFYGVGVGPGDPELITLKGYRVLKEADVSCSPKSKTDKEGVALSVVRSLLDTKQKVLELTFPMTNDKGELELFWDKAVRQILSLLKEGKKVAFITLGDPSLYSTYTYVLKKIKQAGPYPVETIPGVASFCACAAAANIPLTEGDEKLAIIPVVKELDSLRLALQNFENVVLMKTASNYPAVVKILAELGLKDQAIYASRCGLPDGFLKTGLPVCPSDWQGDNLSDEENTDSLTDRPTLPEETEELEELKKVQKDYLSLIIVKRSSYG